MRIGTICYATTQGLGRLAKQFYDAGIITDVMVYCHPTVKHPKKIEKARKTHLEWYPEDTPVQNKIPFRGGVMDQLIQNVDAMLFFETPFDWNFADRCQARGVKTMLIPMYEWYPETTRHNFDLILAPSLLDKDMISGSVFVPIPVDGQYWKQRTTATKFLHNSGNVGCNEHKGTRELLQAMPLLKSDATVLVRTQDESVLKPMVHEVFGDNPLPKNLTIEYGEIPYEELWDGYDVLVAPEKLNGLSLPLQEGRAAGMLVMTTDRYPTNTWLPKEPLIPVAETFKSRVSRGHMQFTECRVTPEDVAKKIDEWYGKDITDYSLAGKYWAEEMSWEKLKPVFVEEIQKLWPQ